MKQQIFKYTKFAILYQYSIYLIQNNVSIETIYFASNLFLVLRGMLSGVMPWPIKLTPMNEVIECENHVENSLARKKNTIMIWEVMLDVRIVLILIPKIHCPGEVARVVWCTPMWDKNPFKVTSGML
jgi:hypothetical protein